jgi:hypothetical protein
MGVYQSLGVITTRRQHLLYIGVIAEEASESNSKTAS